MNGRMGTLRAVLLRFLRVPPEPHPPAGSPGSLRVFRAGDNYRRLLLWAWVGRQALLVAGFVFWLVLAHHILPEDLPVKYRGKDGASRSRTIHTEDYRQWIVLAEVVGLTFGLAQMPFTYVLMRLRYDMHWYMVTDRSLRIREGIGRVKEMTLSFANIQKVGVRQNPFQRLFGLADVEVDSAGGGGGSTQPGQPQGDQFHKGVFRNVSNAVEIRDLIVERQRALRDSGLGDPDESHRPAGPPSASAGAADDDALVAAKELLEEARRLRAALAPP